MTEELNRSNEEAETLRSKGISLRFFTVVLVNTRIEERFPGGIAAFSCEYPGAKLAHGLRAMAVMSSGDLDILLDDLDAFGLRPGMDLAVGEFVHGEWLPCPLVEFREWPSGRPLPEWTAHLVDQSVCR